MNVKHPIYGGLTFSLYRPDSDAATGMFAALAVDHHYQSRSLLTFFVIFLENHLFLFASRANSR